MAETAVKKCVNRVGIVYKTVFMTYSLPVRLKNITGSKWATILYKLDKHESVRAKR